MYPRFIFIFISLFVVESVFALNSCQDLFRGAVAEGRLQPKLSSEDYKVYELGQGLSGVVYRYVSNINASTFIRKVYFRESENQKYTNLGLGPDWFGLVLLKYAIHKLELESPTVWKVAHVKTINYRQNFMELEDARGVPISMIKGFKFNPKAIHDLSRLVQIINQINQDELNQIQRHIDWEGDISQTRSMSLSSDFLSSRDIFKISDQSAVFLASSEGSVLTEVRLLFKADNILLDENGHLVIIDPR